MPLTAGTRLGVFEILAPIGKGGMGEVYRARDTKLGREIAIKVLPDTLTQDPDRLARFQREATLLAALNHPHIASIYGLEEADGNPFLVLELIPGEDLSERIEHGPIPLDEALEIARQIAEALEEAHEHGIVHRDLKPANIKLTQDGKVKVLDFGLAKAYAADETEATDVSQSPTMSAHATAAGLLLGTAAYMSPEQARGKPVDKRADIWAFGVVLFEMLTGKRLFAGETVSDTLASILKEEPDWTLLPADTPRKLSDLLHRCLRRDVRNRLHDIGDARIEIEETLGEPALSAGPAALPAGHSGQRWVTYGLPAALLVGLGLWAMAVRTPQAVHTPMRLSITIPRASQVGGGDGMFNYLELSPDGTRLAARALVDGAWSLYLRPLATLEATPVPASEDAYFPFFSPDDRWLGFWDADTQELKKISVDGGVPITLCDAPDMRGGSWGPDGFILFTPDAWSGLWRVSAEGGTPEELTRPKDEEGESSHRLPEVLPGGQAALFTILAPSGRQDEGRIALLSLETGGRRVLFEGGSSARYVGTGHIVYARNGSLLAVPFDLDSLEVTGAAVPVVDDVWMSPLETGVAQFSISRSGALAYIGESASVPERSLVWVDRQGRVEPVTEERRGFQAPRLSPDGGQLAVSVQDGLNHDVWLYDLRRDTKSRFTFGKNNYGVVWTRDSRQIVFSSNREGNHNLFRKPVDGSGSGSAERLTTTTGSWQNPTGVSPDGRHLAYMQQDNDTHLDIWVLPLEGEGEPQRIVGTRFSEVGGVFSPDGRWLAYVSNESGRDEVYVRPFPGPGRRWPISAGGGQEPLWSPDGRELFYRVGRELMAVPVRTQPTFQPGSPEVLFAGRYYGGPQAPPAYDISPDGQRFVMVQESEDAAPEHRQIIYIPDFFGELKAKMAAARP